MPQTDICLLQLLASTVVLEHSKNTDLVNKEGIRFDLQV
jgi:hypothetical protein